MKGITIMFLVMILSIGLAGAWNSFPIIKNSAHYALDPSAGALMNFNIYFGMILVVFIITFITVIIQKYGTNQVELKKLKEEQKILQAEMKKYSDHPEKLMELQKKSFEFMPRTMDLTMKPLIYTAIPFVLFFRWFNDYFLLLPNFKFFGFLSWFWFYFLASILFSTILRKIMKVH